MDILEALVALGVNQSVLSDDQKRLLDFDGFIHIPGVLTQPEVDALNGRMAEILAEEGESAGLDLRKEPGADRLTNLVNKGTIFHVVLRERRVLAAVAHVLRWDVKLSSINGRTALPGQGLQPLHTDGRPTLGIPGDYQVCNSIWLLDDFTPDNGATRAVPGTHLTGGKDPRDTENPNVDPPNQVLLLGKAGDVFVFNSHVWHGGTVNRTDKPRRSLHGYFCRRGRPAQMDQQKALRPETRRQLSHAQLVLLGCDS